jgi:hypothetical protein
MVGFSARHWFQAVEPFAVEPFLVGEMFWVGHEGRTAKEVFSRVEDWRMRAVVQSSRDARMRVR